MLNVVERNRTYHYCHPYTGFGILALASRSGIEPCPKASHHLPRAPPGAIDVFFVVRVTECVEQFNEMVHQDGVEISHQIVVLLCQCFSLATMFFILVGIRHNAAIFVGIVQ